jgi:hypothetical protein
MDEIEKAGHRRVRDNRKRQR